MSLNTILLPGTCKRLLQGWFAAGEAALQFQKPVKNRRDQYLPHALVFAWKRAIRFLKGCRRSPCLCTGHFQGKTRKGCTHIQKVWGDLPRGCYKLTGEGRIWQPLLWLRVLLQSRTVASTHGWADCAAESGSGDRSRNVRNEDTRETTAK